MLRVEDYGSDSDNDNNDDIQQTSPPPAPKRTSSQAPQKTGLSLPPPSSTAPSSSKPSSGLSLPPPKKRGPKKITIGLPSLSSENGRDADERPPPAKKARIESGAGASALLSMLPAPKNKNPVMTQERMLGGGRGPGLVFHTGLSRSAPQQQQQQANVQDADDDEDEDAAHRNEAPLSSGILEQVTEVGNPASSSLPFLPPSLARGKANVSTEEKYSVPKSATVKPSAPAIDFFSLGTATSSPIPTSAPTSAPNTSTSSIPSILPPISSAPAIADFTPPEPTPQDPYPGYYLLPSGSWASYDPVYYQTFYKKWKKAYEDHVRALEKGVEKGFEDVERDGAQEVNALKEMERAKKEVQEREEKKALTAGAANNAAAPNMNIKGAALSGRARTRHQLSSLLTEAYQNREALEERIAQGRKNRKEAGNKYGTYWASFLYVV
ncbi:hypothetical protein PHLCEN_2v10049 [Hermanssonia centrifuga]|uniref:Mitotic checkpoint regulator, MAD2B-interacting-domain-containing protein n=1 Tax=Hermanssonia centrifuga TaxID=98765 RepID=A0A2R6NNT5_9APHY|nr:hypothetical protein PHLCEN_2v10049 [Hermanssonia centrifuga]